MRPPLGAVLRIFFVSTFVGTFLPASVGGDAVRAYSLAKLNVRGGDAVASVFMDRMLGVASLLLMALVGLPLARDLAANSAIVAALARARRRSASLTLLLIFSRRIAARGVAMHRRGCRSRGAARRPPACSNRFGGTPAITRSWPTCSSCSIAVQVLRIVQAYCLGRGLGIDAPLTTYFAFIPLILLVMLLPVTFNGIGTSQAAFVWFFARAGVAAAPRLRAVGAVRRARHRRQPARRNPLRVRARPAATPIACDHDATRPATRRRLLKGLGIVVYNLIAADDPRGNRSSS